MSVWYRGSNGTIGTVISSLLCFLFFLILSIGILFIAIKLLINGENIFFAICCLIVCPLFIFATKGMYEGMKEEIKLYKNHRN